jgi:sugar lactone lactonase YvrE
MECTVSEPEVLLERAGELCEGPCWDARSRRLVFVDILAGLVHAVDPTSGARSRWQLGVPVGAVAPRRDAGWVAAVERGFARFDADWTAVGPVLPAPGQPAGTRFNDGGCDPAGRFWAGTLDYDGAPGRAALYRLDPDGTVTEMLTGVTNSNGLAWSPDGRLLYYVDTGKATLDRMRFDPREGTVADRRTLVAFRPDEGLPDGLTCDREGFLWVALWGGGCVRRYSPDGVRDGAVRLPAAQVSSVAFGGPDLDELFITSAWQGLSAAQRREQPLAGSVFRYRPGVRGLPPLDYAG